MAKELVVFDTKKHPLLVGTGDVTEVLQSNLGGEEISPNDLAMVKMPTGGGVHWAVPTAEGEESVPTITGVIVHIARTRAWWQSNETTGDPPGPGAEAAGPNPRPEPLRCRRRCAG